MSNKDNKYNNIVIKTKNFYLRQFNKENDFDLYYNFWNDKHVLESMECKPRNRKDIEEYFQIYESWMDKFSLPNFAVFKKEADDFVGSCGMSLFHNFHGERNPLTPINSGKYLNKDIEISYVFHKKYWGKGYTTEIVKACIDFVFDNYFDIKRIVAVTAPNNIASQKVLSKIGFEFCSVNNTWNLKENFYFINKKKYSNNIGN